MSKLRDRIAYRLMRSSARLASKQYRDYVTVVQGMGVEEFDRRFNDEVDRQLISGDGSKTGPIGLVGASLPDLNREAE